MDNYEELDALIWIKLFWNRCCVTLVNFAKLGDHSIDVVQWQAQSHPIRHVTLLIQS